MKIAHQKAKNEGYLLGAKLVRGAYMEKEAAYALKNGLANPIQTSKENTDKDFDSAALYCIENVDGIHFCAGSHNEKSNQLLAEKMDNLRLKRDDHRIWFAQLLGMSDNISFALAKEGFNVAKYVPYGPVFSVMPYLVRRASENTSVAGQTSRELALIQKERKRRA
jgi:proline dehydrogenase